MNIITVKSNKERDMLKLHADNEIVYSVETQKYYQWVDGAWHDYTPASELKMNYRNLVINSISQFSPMSTESITRHQMQINKWHNDNPKEFYMLYGKELDYFTIFRFVEDNSNRCLGKELFECLSVVGDILYIEEYDAQSEHIIFWVKTPNGLITELYLFDYTEGVVPFTC